MLLYKREEIPESFDRSHYDMDFQAQFYLPSILKKNI